eukprot:3937089-Rhodomonas_salina.1
MGLDDSRLLSLDERTQGVWSGVGCPGGEGQGQAEHHAKGCCSPGPFCSRARARAPTMSFLPQLRKLDLRDCLNLTDIAALPQQLPRTGKRRRVGREPSAGGAGGGGVQRTAAAAERPASACLLRC